MSPSSALTTLDGKLAHELLTSPDRLVRVLIDQRLQLPVGRRLLLGPERALRLELGLQLHLEPGYLGLRRGDHLPHRPPSGVTRSSMHTGG